MTKRELNQIHDAVEAEGFDYALRFWSNFENIKDKKFRTLMQDYRKAGELLARYLKLEDFL